MRALPCLQDLKRQARTFIDTNRHRVAPVDVLVAELAQFMSQMSTKFAANEAWKNKHPNELDNAIEGLEHFLCMNLYKVLFNPQLSDDSDKDKLLYDRVILLSFIEGKHLDLPSDCCRADDIAAAANLLANLDKHKTPREKLECITAACAVLRTMLKHPSIDREQFFLSALLLAVLQAKPRHLFSNIQFIRRFRNPKKITSDDEYCLAHMDGAVDYLEKVQPQWLSIEPAEFDASVNRSVDSLGEEGSAAAQAKVDSPSPACPAPAASPAPARAQTKQPSTSSTLTVCGASAGDLPSQITPTANAPAPWRTESTTSTLIGSYDTHTPAPAVPSTETLAAGLGSGWCDIGAELASGSECASARRGSLASLVPAGALASACSGSSGIASDLADLDPLGHCTTVADADTLSLHSLAWPSDPPPRSRTASMRSALSHHSTDVAQCHAADLMAFASTAPAPSTSSPGRLARAPQPLDPYRDGGIAQLLEAASEPPVAKFLTCDVEGLNMNDIPLLLADYKRIATLNASLSRVLRLNMQ